MALDRNKTALTHRVTAVAAACLAGIGCKPVETEVEVRAGWIADVASYWYPTWTEAKKMHLHKRVRELLQITADNERNLLFHAYGHGPFTVLVEVKTTRADFTRDTRKWDAETFPAHVCFLAFPAGVVKPEEIPQGWYAIETSKDGTTVRKIHRPFGRLHPQHPGLVLDFVASVGIRRDHRTSYAATRQWLASYRARATEDKRSYSTARLLEGLANWLQHKGDNPERPLAKLLSELGIKKLPHYLKKSLEDLEGLRRKPLTPNP